MKEKRENGRKKERKLKEKFERKNLQKIPLKKYTLVFFHVINFIARASGIV